MPPESDWQMPTPAYSRPSPSRSPLPVSQLQEIDIQLSILRGQLLAIDDPIQQETPAREEEEENLPPVDGEDEQVQPTAILGLLGTGRGRYTRYKVSWSDGSQTANSAGEISELAPDLLRAWRRANATKNNRNSRNRKRNESGSDSGGL